MTWNIPPVGWCVTCLALDQKQPAAALFKGNSLCQRHLKAVLADEIDDALRGTGDQIEEALRGGGEEEEGGPG